MARVFVAGPAFTPQDRGALDAIAQAIRELGHHPVVDENRRRPDPGDASPSTNKPSARLLESCDAMVAILDGLDVEAGTAFQIGYAAALNRPVLGLVSDLRAAGSPGSTNMVVGMALSKRVAVESWASDVVRPSLEEFLVSVRVYAGRLVRDAVPRMLKRQGQDVAIQRVDPSAYPVVVKRRIVEIARALETTEFGKEQEVLADLLEGVEALINARGYDKDSLRAIKEGTWRKRGGYEKGYVLEEEPNL